MQTELKEEDRGREGGRSRRKREKKKTREREREDINRPRSRVMYNCIRLIYGCSGFHKRTRGQGTNIHTQCVSTEV